jgi:hypothetical protein
MSEKEVNRGAGGRGSHGLERWVVLVMSGYLVAGGKDGGMALLVSIENCFGVFEFGFRNP